MLRQALVGLERKVPAGYIKTADFSWLASSKENLSRGLALLPRMLNDVRRHVCSPPSVHTT